MTEPRSKAGTAFLATPVLLGAALLVSTGAVILLGNRVGPATGERLRIHVSAPCGDAVGDLMVSRAEAIGLGDPVLTASSNGVVLEATMPGLADDRTAMPTLLSSQGSLSIKANDKSLASNEDLLLARVELDGSGMPNTHIQVNRAATDRILQALSDGHSLTAQVDEDTIDLPETTLQLENQTLVLGSGGGSPAGRMRLAVDRSILIGHGPLPCKATIEEVVAIPDEG